MAFVASTAIGLGLSVLPSIYKGIKGIGQSNKANKMHPISPGYRMNQGVIDNARTLSDTYNNYTMPGYGQAQSNINSTFKNAYDTGVQGASSGNDVLELATRMAYGKNQANNQLSVQNAQGKQSLLGEYLNANAAAGQEQVNANAYDRDQYDRQLKEKAALTQAGAQNTYGAVDQLAGIGAKYAFAKSGNSSSTAITPDDAAGSSTYNQYFYPNGSPRFDANGNPIPSVQWQGTPGSNAFNGAG